MFYGKIWAVLRSLGNKELIKPTESKTPSISHIFFNFPGSAASRVFFLTEVMLLTTSSLQDHVYIDFLQTAQRVLKTNDNDKHRVPTVSPNFSVLLMWTICWWTWPAAGRVNSNTPGPHSQDHTPLQATLCVTIIPVRTPALKYPNLKDQAIIWLTHFRPWIHFSSAIPGKPEQMAYEQWLPPKYVGAWPITTTEQVT
jgi:hypothetical protein